MMKINGKIEGYLESHFFEAAFNLTAGLGLFPQAEGYKRYAAELASKGKTTIPQKETEILYSNMKNAYLHLSAIQVDQRKERYGVTQKRLDFFAKTISDVEFAIAKGNGLPISNIDKVPSNDLSGAISLKTLLKKFNLLTNTEKVSNILNGRIISYQAENPQKPLVIVFLDRHDLYEVQKEIRENILKLHQRGLTTQGLEGSSGERSFIADYQNDPQKTYTFSMVNQSILIKFEPKRCVENQKIYLDELNEKKIPIAAGYFVECLLGNKIKSFGLEDPELAQKAQFLETPAANSLNPYERAQRESEIALERGTKMTENLLTIMAKEKTKLGSMIIGMGHLHEVIEALAKQKSNFIVVATPSLKSLIQKSILQP